MKKRKSKKLKQSGPLAIPLPFDEAIVRALRVKPPRGGWRELDKKARPAAPKKRRKRPEPKGE